MKSRRYEIRTPENKLLTSLYGYTPEEAANSYFISRGVKPTSITENSEGTFDVFVKGRIFKMLPKEQIN